MLTEKEKKYLIFVFIGFVGVLYDLIPAPLNLRGFIDLVPAPIVPFIGWAAFYINKFFNVVFLYGIFMAFIHNIKKTK